MAKQERYSQIVEAKLRSTSIFANLLGRQYEGEPKAGCVKVPYRAEATVKAYVPSAGISGTDTATSFRQIDIDKDYAVNEICDGWEAASVPDGMIAERLDSAGYALGKQADDDILDMITKVTGSVRDNATAITGSSTKIADIIVDGIAQAKTAGVDANKLFAVVSPANYAKLLKETIFVQCTSLDDIQNGLIGHLAGIPVYECNSAKFTDTVLIGNSDFMHFIMDFQVAPTVRDGVGQYIGSAQVVARVVYGCAVTNKATVFYK